MTAAEEKAAMRALTARRSKYDRRACALAAEIVRVDAMLRRASPEIAAQAQALVTEVLTPRPQPGSVPKARVP